MSQEYFKNSTTKNSSTESDKDPGKTFFFVIFLILVIIATILTFYRSYIDKNVRYFTEEEEVINFNPFSLHEYY